MKKILSLSPTLTAGSWVCVEEYLKPIAENYDITTIGLGNGRGVPGTKTIKIPYPLFEKFNPKYGGNIYLNILYQIPLNLLSALYVIFWQPNVIISNGFTPILFSLPFVKLFNIPLVIYYGSFLSEVIKAKPYILPFFKFLNIFSSSVLVNSRGSLEDVSHFIDPKKVTIIEHWTDIKRVDHKEREDIRNKYQVTPSDYILLYVGRLVEEKGVLRLLQSLPLLKDVPHLQVWFVGNGKMQPEVEKAAQEYSFVKYKGFVTDRVLLREFYAIGDVCWTFADDTYVAKPGIESLAVGTPLMIPNTAAIIEKFEVGGKIDPHLIPNKVGWIVNDDNLSEVANLIKEIVVDRKTDSMRNDCHAYAQDKHSYKNIESAINIIKNYAK
jgi:teichuronic acid biosynthesis glycosyltransferase TuaC